MTFAGLICPSICWNGNQPVSVIIVDLESTRQLMVSFREIE